MALSKNPLIRKLLTALVFVIAAYLFMRVWNPDAITRIVEQKTAESSRTVVPSGEDSHDRR